MKKKTTYQVGCFFLLTLIIKKNFGKQFERYSASNGVVNV
jgi:hypothetical protein